MLSRSLLSSRVWMSVTYTPVLYGNGQIYHQTFYLGLVAPSLWFSITISGCEILTERGAYHSRRTIWIIFGLKHLIMAVLESKRLLIVIVAR